MKIEEFTSHEQALLDAWDDGNSPRIDDTFEARMLVVCSDTMKVSPRNIEARDRATRLQMNADAELETMAAAHAGRPELPPPAPQPDAPPGLEDRLRLEVLPRPRPYLKQLLPDPEWPGIIDDVLGTNAKAAELARSTMWLEVSFYVERVARLPIGPLNDDEEARRDIGVRVLRKLEAKSSLHLREWRARQLTRQDHALWWTLIKIVSRCVAIDYARTSRRNIAPRGKPFEYARVEFVDPFVLGSSLESLARCGEQGLYEVLANFQASPRLEQPG